MNAIIRIDKAGRVVIPWELREALHLTPGTRLKIERTGDRLMLTPVAITGRLVIENGVPLIYPADASINPVVTNEMVNAMIEGDRARRIADSDEEGR